MHARAPTSTVTPFAEIATESPNWSPLIPSLAVSSPACRQPDPDLANMYAAPVFPSCPGAPTTTVPPRAEIATDKPNEPPAGGVSSAVWLQLCPCLVNTYTAS
jgi:hypothetical protein